MSMSSPVRCTRRWAERGDLLEDPSDWEGSRPGGWRAGDAISKDGNKNGATNCRVFALSRPSSLPLSDHDLPEPVLSWESRVVLLWLGLPEWNGQPPGLWLTETER